MSRCAFTGYRPEKLAFGYNESHPDCEKLKQRLFCEILRLTREGVNVFISGMAQGVDTWAAETVLQLKRTLPSREIQLWAVVPYERQSSAWSEDAQQRYQDILDQADKVEYISHDYVQGCLQKRNRHMVELADVLLAVYDGKPGGTKSTIDYAQRKGRTIIIIEP